MNSTFDVSSLTFAEGLGGYYADDLTAIQNGATADGFAYRGRGQTPGHERVRNPARAVVIRIQSDDGTVGWGDAVGVQYSGFGDRDLPLSIASAGPQIEAAAASLKAAGRLTFEQGCEIVEGIQLEGRPLDSGVRYGLSVALLNLATATTPARPAVILGRLLGSENAAAVPLYAQSGEDRRNGADKMILKAVDVLPHGLINSPGAFGRGGETFLEYVSWVRARITELGESGYAPTLHFDVYGLLGREMQGDEARMVRFCERLFTAAGGLEVQLESPLYGQDARATAGHLARLRAALRRSGVPVRLVADDWCNTLADIRLFGELGAADMVQIKMPDLGALTNAVAAIQAARDCGVDVFIGGSCTETDLTARASVQLAVAAHADQVLAKPGMGVDEAIAITRNEMLRACMT